MSRTTGSPRTARQHQAYDCGYRVGSWDDYKAVDAINRGDNLDKWLTRQEIAAYRAGGRKAWSVWWWRGYRAGRESRGQ